MCMIRMYVNIYYVPVCMYITRTILINVQENLIAVNVFHTTCEGPHIPCNVYL